MRKSYAILLGIVAGLVVFVLLPVMATYNSLVNSEENVTQAWANVESTYQRRADLIPNLVTTVQGYAAHETAIFNEITAANVKLAEAINGGSFEDVNAANDELTGSLSRLVALAQDYPELQASTVFVGMMDELEGTENRINYARQKYNAAATSYNKKLRTFPSSLVAGVLGFERHEVFRADPGSSTAPTVQFPAPTP